MKKEKKYERKLTEFCKNKRKRVEYDFCINCWIKEKRYKIYKTRLYCQKGILKDLKGKKNLE